MATVAGPGSGKTTMQEGLAVKLRRKGHERVLKLFFNSKAADDGRVRLDARLKEQHVKGGVECLTTHGAALSSAARPTHGVEPCTAPWRGFARVRGSGSVPRGQNHKRAPRR